MAAAALLASFNFGETGLQLYDESLNAALVRSSGLGAAFSPLLLRGMAFRAVGPAALQTLARRLALLLASVLAVALGTGLLGAIPHAWLLAWFSSAFAAAVVGRLVAARLLRVLVAERLVRDRVAVVGAGPDAEWLRDAFETARPFGLELVGPRRPLGTVADAVADLLERGRRGELDRVVLAPSGLGDADIRRIAHQLKALQIEVASLHPLLAAGGRLRTTEIADIPLFLIAPRPQQGYGGLSKDVLDRMFALRPAALDTAGPVADRAGHPPRQPGAGVVPPAPPRRQRRRVRDLQVPHHAVGGAGGRDRRGADRPP